MIGSQLLGTAFPAVRHVLGDSAHRLGDEAIESILANAFPNSHAEDVEDIMSSLQSFARQAAPIAQRALPGIAQGAMQGAAVGGPWGALIGAAAGGVSSALSGGGPQPQPGGSAPVPQPIVGAQPGALGPQPGGTPLGANPDIAQLLLLLSRPETMQALLSMLMSRGGQPPVQVGARQVPAPAFANAIAELAGRAVEASESLAGDVASYLVDSRGAPRCDAYNPAERASLLIADLAEVAEAEAAEYERDTWDQESDALEESPEEGIDMVDAFEAALEGETFS